MKYAIRLNNNTVTLVTKKRQLKTWVKLTLTTIAIIAIIATLIGLYTIAKQPYTYDQCIKDHYGWNPDTIQQQCIYLNK